MISRVLPATSHGRRPLLGLLVLLPTLTACGVPGLLGGQGGTPVTGALTPDTELLLKYTNGLRESGVTCRGRNYPPSLPFKLDSALTRAATLRAQDMARSREFTHQPTDGKDMLYWTEFAGVDLSSVSWVSENLAYVPNPIIAAAGWLGSEDGHCEAQYTGEYTSIGLGEAKGQDGMTYFVALHTR